MRWSESELAALGSLVAETNAQELQADPTVIEGLAATATAELIDRIDVIRRELIEGSGLALVAGLSVDASTNIGRERAAITFLLVGALLGSLRSQNAAGHLLGHVTDVGADVNDPTTRIYQTNERQTFHTDSTDAVGLLCLRTARTGGASMVVSADAVYEQMVGQAPELAARLFDPIATDRRGEQPPGQDPWFEIPVLSRSGDRVTVLYQRQYIDSARRFADAPRPDAEQIRALDLFDDIMNDPAMHFRMDFTPGDMQFVYNHGLLHDRTSFVDHDDPALRRHLLRVWVSLPGDRALPDSFRQRYGSIAVGDRGGIVTEHTTPSISFVP